MTFDPQQIETLWTRLQGSVLLPGNEGYDRARQTWDAKTFDQHPALIVMPTVAADVQAAVTFAREQHLPVAIQGGGHGHPHPADDALLVNFATMTGVQIEPETATTRVEPGATWKDVIQAASPYGLAPLNEFAASVGVVGYLLGFLLIASGLGLLLFGLSNLAYEGWGSLLTVTGPVILALLLLLLFIPIELRTARPLLNLRLFTRRNFLVGNLITWVAVASLFGSTFLLPQYLQVLRGLSSYNAGLLLAPQGLASIAGTIVVGTLYSRVGPRPLVLFGAIAVGTATYLISRWATLTSPFTLLIPLLVVLGLALPCIAQTTGTAAMTGIVGTALPGANTLLSVSRSAVSSLAVTGLVNLVQAQRLVHQAALAHNGPVSVAITQQAQALAYQDVYLLSALVTLPLIVLAFFLSSPRRAQKPESTTTFGVSPQTPEAAVEPR
jgi:FAD binding domain